MVRTQAINALLVNFEVITRQRKHFLAGGTDNLDYWQSLNSIILSAIDHYNASDDPQGYMLMLRDALTCFPPESVKWEESLNNFVLEAQLVNKVERKLAIVPSSAADAFPMLYSFA
jgi:hypothetical protein